MNSKKAKALRKKLYAEESAKREDRTLMAYIKRDQDGRVVDRIGGLFHTGLRAEYQKAKRGPQG